jgi:hypothetical protein
LVIVGWSIKKLKIMQCIHQISFYGIIQEILRTEKHQDSLCIGSSVPIMPNMGLLLGLLCGGRVAVGANGRSPLQKLTVT